MELTPRNSTSDDRGELTSDTIIILTVENSYKFQSGTYKEEMLRDLISKLDYDKIVSQASRLMENCWIQKRQNDLIKTPKLIISLSSVAIALMFMYLVLIYLSSASQDEDTLFIISLVCVVMSVLIIIGLSFYNFFRKEGKSICLDEIIQMDIDNLFVKVNKTHKGKLCFKYDPEMRNIICKMVKYNLMDVKEERRNLITEENRFLR